MASTVTVSFNSLGLCHLISVLVRTSFRYFVNDELNELHAGIEAAFVLLKQEGLLVVSAKELALNRVIKDALDAFQVVYHAFSLLLSFPRVLALSFSRALSRSLALALALALARARFHNLSLAYTSLAFSVIL